MSQNVIARITNTGILYSNNYFDEISLSINDTSLPKISTIAIYSSELDEVNVIDVAQRFTSTGIIQVQNYFDEITTTVIPKGPANTSPPYLILDTVATYLRDYLSSDLRNPNFNEYNLDGPDTSSRIQSPYFILDGGGDMFDGGNYTAPWLYSNTNYTNSQSIPTNLCINYNDQTTSANVLDTNFYYASLGYSNTARPLTVLGARSNTGSPTGFQKAGDSGADGTGLRANGAIYSGNTVNGFTVYATYTQSYNTTDPIVCDIFMLLGHSNWNSTFDKVRRIEVAGTLLQGGALIAFGANTANVMTITTLVSKPSTTQIPFNDLKNIVDNYTIKIGEALNF
jgi:hypothetical protein